jgi:hypothetical protein
MAAVGLTNISELVAKIVDYTPTSSLSSLALVSQHFKSLVVPRLYKSIFYGMSAWFHGIWVLISEISLLRIHPSHDSRPQMFYHRQPNIFTIGLLIIASRLQWFCKPESDNFGGIG